MELLSVVDKDVDIRMVLAKLRSEEVAQKRTLFRAIKVAGRICDRKHVVGRVGLVLFALQVVVCKEDR